MGMNSVTELLPGVNAVLEKFPRTHLAIVGTIVLTSVLGSVVLPGDKPEPERVSQTLELPPENTIVEEVAPAVAELRPMEEDTGPDWQELTVTKGDTLSDIFRSQQWPYATLLSLLDSGKEGKQLTRIFPGQKLSYLNGDGGELLKLQQHHNELESTLFSLNSDQIDIENIIRVPDINHQFRQASVRSSLFNAGKDAALSEGKVMELAHIFEGVIDFVFDPRKGDTFDVMYEEHFLDGEHIGDGPILAARYNNAGKLYTAYRYVDEDGRVGYYNPEGVSMRKAFLRAPLDFTRVSSNFNLRRMHPIHKRIKAHRGTDYAAPRGTPVYAAGDGRVVRAGYTKGNGNFVVIQHGEKYMTKYLHLDRRKVKTGSRVSQKDIIGTVGSTGYATGPHLHYEFLVNGVHRNPRTILSKLPKAESIPKSKLNHFKATIAATEQRLADMRGEFDIAANEATNPDVL